MAAWFRSAAVVVGLLVVAGFVFLPGVNWGLPSREPDRFLFGDRTPWTGQEILALTGAWDAGGTLGADVDRDPLARGGAPLRLNETDQQRAQIVRRYRLYSYQPDEMITFRSLGRMRPGGLDLDPQLYQYGGLWIYPVGALLKAGSILGLIDLRSHLAHYLDHPDAFGRFYVVARLYSVAWGLVGVWAVWWIVRRFVGGVLMPVVAALCFMFMPVVVTMAHEAKPHLPGAVLALLATIAATLYVQTGRRRWWVAAGALCGASLGMVLSMLPAFALLPAMVLGRPMPWLIRGRVMVLAALVGAVVYAVTNPYVPLRVLDEYVLRPHVGPLRSNLENSKAMYRVGAAGSVLRDGAGLLALGASPVLAAAGVAGALGLAARRVLRRGGASAEPSVGRSDVAWLLAAPAGVAAIQFFALSAGKPPEYARFGILPDVALLIAAIGAAAALLPPLARAGVLALLAGTTAVWGSTYVTAFVRDAMVPTSRLAAAAQLAERPGGTIGLVAEPAPYSCPPINLFDRRLVLLPEGAPGLPAAGQGVDLIVSVQHRTGAYSNLLPRDTGPHGRLARPADPAMAWADKRFSVEAAPPAAPNPR